MKRTMICGLTLLATPAIALEGPPTRFIDNARVRVADETLQPGQQDMAIPHAGDIVFNVANRSHSEELVKGEQAGIMLELK